MNEDYITEIIKKNDLLIKKLDQQIAEFEFEKENLDIPQLDEQEIEELILYHKNNNTEIFMECKEFIKKIHQSNKQKEKETATKNLPKPKHWIAI